MSSLLPPPSMDSSPPILKSHPFYDPDIQTLIPLSPFKLSSPLNLTIHELLLLPLESHDLLPLEATPRRKSKSRAPANPISPRNGRRGRRRLEKENVREEKMFNQVEDDAGKLKKRRQSRPRPARKETLSLVQSLTSSCPETKHENITVDDQRSLEVICKTVSDLVMWKNVAKSSLWFGFGSIMFLSSIFSGDVGFSLISTVAHLGILILSLAFFNDSIRQRKQEKKKATTLRLTEEDFLRITRLILPAVNAALSKCQQTFSGKPLMTLKVAPVLLFLAKYGHFTTPWRLLAIGFFSSFTVPKLYSCYYQQIQQRVEEARSYVLESWRSCSRKKLVAISVAALLWNIFSVKMRIFAAFITVVILRYHHEEPFIQEYAVEENVINERERELGEEENLKKSMIEEKTQAKLKGQ